MKRIAAGVVALIVALWVTIYWVEAEKEIVVLCGLGRVGTPAAELTRLYGTASLSKLRVDSVGTRHTMMLASPRNRSLTTCIVTVEDGSVTFVDYNERLRLAPLISLRRSQRVEYRVSVAALTPLVPESVVEEVLVGTVLVLSVASYIAVLGLARQRLRWLKAASLLVVVSIGVILFVGG